jgi:hypothetical protein
MKRRLTVAVGCKLVTFGSRMREPVTVISSAWSAPRSVPSALSVLFDSVGLSALGAVVTPGSVGVVCAWTPADIPAARIAKAEARISNVQRIALIPLCFSIL